jgi:hypothetical protein
VSVKCVVVRYLTIEATSPVYCFCLRILSAYEPSIIVKPKSIRGGVSRNILYDRGDWVHCEVRRIILSITTLMALDEFHQYLVDDPVSLQTCGEDQAICNSPLGFSIHLLLHVRGGHEKGWSVNSFSSLLWMF